MDPQALITEESEDSRLAGAQRLRFKRFMMAVASYAAGTLMIGLLVWLDYLTASQYLFFISLMIAINSLFFLLFKTGLNLRFNDPSLTSLQIIASTVLTIQISYMASDGRGMLLLIYLVAHIFGAFRLTFRQFLLLDAFTISAYALMLSLLVQNRPEAIDLKLELLHWGALCITLPCFALLGAYLNRLRERLRERNNNLNQALKKIQELAITDELTGLANRRSIMEQLANEWERSKRNQRPFCIALIDIDFFKEINDTYGHLAGDTVLQQFSSLVSQELRSPDKIGRYGGEEFLLIMPDTHVSEAEKVADRIRRTISQHEHGNIAPGLTIQVSIGIAEYDNQPIQEIIKRADLALYQSKNSGRNRVSVHPLENP
ncbi:MAG: GGDEF domain-containing protein [Sedimenticola sp.]|nr:GGDEF domain-containing protein [Sedimenticola sp.]